MNQCDGCKAGMHVINNIHFTQSGKPYMACTAEKYSLLSRLKTMGNSGWHPIGTEAANEIEKLRAALKQIISYNEDIIANRINYRPEDHIQIAKTALKETI